MYKFGLVIQARIGSTRLPGKVLMDFCGRPLLQFQIELLQQFSLVDHIIVATSVNPLDDAIEELCITRNIPFVRGSEENVFGRFQLVARKFQFDAIVRLTGDNPLTNYQILKTCQDIHKKYKADLTTTREILRDHTVKRYSPKGSSVDIINAQALLTIDSSTLDEYQREHVIPVFFDRRYDIEVVKDFNHLTKSNSIDDIADYQRVQAYAQNFVEEGQLLKAVGYC